MASDFNLPIFMTILACAFLCLMTDFRYGKKQVGLTLLACMAIIIGANLAAYLVMGFDLYSRISLLTLHLPMLLMFLLLSKYRDFRTVFSWLTAIVVVYQVTLAGMVCALPFAGNAAADLTGRIVAAILLLFLWWRLRPLFLSMQGMLQRGWWVFCLMPIGYYASAYFFIMRVHMADRDANLPLLLLMTCVVAAAYCLLFWFFRQMRESMRRENERRLLKTQISVLGQQRQTLRQKQQQLSVLRHDMRHYTVHVAALLREGKVKEALRLTEHLDGNLLQTAPVRRCENDMLDPILSYYLGRAEEEGIEVDAQLDLPQNLPVDETELSTVLANAIENAIHACLRQQEGMPRKIAVTAATDERLAIKISNTYGGEVRFGRQGMPVAEGEGHDIGTQSIAAFAKKHHAFCEYALEDGMVCLYLLI